MFFHAKEDDEQKGEIVSMRCVLRALYCWELCRRIQACRSDLPLRVFNLTNGVVVVEPPLFLPSSIEEGTRARRIFNDKVVTKPSFGSAGHAGNAYPGVRMLGRLTRGVHLLLIRTTWNAFGKQLIL